MDKSTFYKYGAFLIGLTLTLIFGQLFLQRIINHQAKYGAIINQAGRQRMLSQSITKNILKYSFVTNQDERQSCLVELKKNLKQFKSAHAQLTPEFDQLQKEYLKQKLQIHSIFLKFSTSAELLFKALQSDKIKSPDEVKKAYSIVLEMESKFLKEMEYTTHALELQSVSKIEQLKRFEYLFMALSFILLMLEILLIFNPLLNQLRTSKNEKELLEIKNINLENFNYTTSHDLKGPIRTVNSYVQILQEYKNSIAEPEVNFVISQIGKLTKNMSEMITSLLEMSRIGQGSSIELVSFNQLVDQAVQNLSADISENRAKIKAYSLPSGKCYPQEIVRLFQNIIENSIKYAKEGVAPLIEISCKVEKDLFHFQIRDNGIGLDPKHVDRIFLPFYQLKIKEKAEGQGIGLANCVKIVSLHLGKIWAESNGQSGSIFHFTISKKL